MFNPYSTAPIETRSAVDFLLDDETLTSTDGLVALAGELLAPMCTSSEFIATRNSFKGLCALGSGVVEKVATALQSDAPQELVEPARQGIASFLSLLEDREQDDISEVYAATLLLRIALAQFEAHMVTRAQPASEETGEVGDMKQSTREAVANFEAQVRAMADMVAHSDGRLVHILDAAGNHCARAREMATHSDAHYALQAAESLIEGAHALAVNEDSIDDGVAGLLGMLKEAAGAFTNSFDVGGEIYVAALVCEGEESPSVAPPEVRESAVAA